METQQSPVVAALRSGTRPWRIAVVNGTNMSNLVNRDPERFGPPMTIEELDAYTVATGRLFGLQVTTMHSNHDGVIIEWLHEHAYGPNLDGILINPAGLTNYAEHVRHCLEECRLPYIEMHFANIAKTGHDSVFTRTAVGVVQGFRKHTYASALLAMANLLDDPHFPKPPRRHPLA